MDSILPVIMINLNSGDEENKTVASPSANKQSDNPDESSQGITGAEKAVRRLVSFGTAKHIAGKLIQNKISTVELRTGAREYEQTLQFGMQVANTAIGIGAAFVANPWLGAAALALTVIDKTIDYSRRVREIEIKENREDISLGLARIRAGFVNPVATPRGRE